MKTPIRFTFLTLLALAGLCISIYQVQHFFEVRNGLVGFKTFCTFGKFDCQAIDSSPYAQLLPGFPLASFAAGWMLSITIISLIARSVAWRREAMRALIALTSVGVAFAAFYFFIMFAILKTYCLLCLTIDAINLASFGLVVSLVPGNIKRAPTDPNRWKPFAGIVAGGVVFALFLSLMMGNGGPSKQEITDLVNDITRSPVLPVVVDDSLPSFGPKVAPITIVKFSDFQCPACRRGAFTIHPVLKNYSPNVRLVYRNYPLDMACNRKITHPMHPRACELAQFAWCQNQFGKFEETYTTLFDQQDKTGTGDLFRFFEFSTEQAMKVSECVKSPVAKEAISKDIEEGIRLNVQSTPTFFINGHRVEGLLPTDIWSLVIDKLLSEMPAQAKK